MVNSLMPQQDVFSPPRENSDNRKERTGNKKLTKHIAKTVALTLAGIAVLALIVGGVYYFIKSKPELMGAKEEENQQLTDAQIQDIVSEVGQLILLPSDETPTVATVSDLSSLKSQDFFKNAQVGDRVLVYKNAKRAYLYRPSEKRLIEVGTINFDQQNVAGESDEIPIIIPTPLPTTEEVQPSETPSPTPSETLTPSPSPTVQPTVTVTPSATPTTSL